MTLLTILLNFCGVFAVVLGLLHFTFPEKFGFAAVMPKDGVPIPPFRLAFYRYEMKCSDLRGIIYVMNHCMSYVILASGVFDLFAQKWFGTFPGSLAACLIGGFWLDDLRLVLNEVKGDVRRFLLRSFGRPCGTKFSFCRKIGIRFKDRPITQDMESATAELFLA